MALEYFADVKTRLSSWAVLKETADFRRLSEEFHRSKGGAALFGFERLRALFGDWEEQSRIEMGEFDLDGLCRELEVAEAAVSSGWEDDHDG